MLCRPISTLEDFSAHLENITALRMQDDLLHVTINCGDHLLLAMIQKGRMEVKQVFDSSSGFDRQCAVWPLAETETFPNWMLCLNSLLVLDFECSQALQQCLSSGHSEIGRIPKGRILLKSVSPTHSLSPLKMSQEDQSLPQRALHATFRCCAEAAVCFSFQPLWGHQQLEQGTTASHLRGKCSTP